MGMFRLRRIAEEVLFLFKVTDRRKEHTPLELGGEGEGEDIRDRTRSHNEILKRWTIPEVVHVEPIAVNVPPKGFTRDWALIELYNDKIDWATFGGNKVYIVSNPST
ncbi:hypothetical protein DFH27DRAFT_607145 [Peziza echinospora]|nr:hypothetical protein DFH27DRAFT_607145 [Peziza echinospora]